MASGASGEPTSIASDSSTDQPAPPFPPPDHPISSISTADTNNTTYEKPEEAHGGIKPTGEHNEPQQTNTPQNEQEGHTPSAPDALKLAIPSSSNIKTPLNSALSDIFASFQPVMKRSKAENVQILETMGWRRGDPNSVEKTNFFWLDPGNPYSIELTNTSMCLFSAISILLTFLLTNNCIFSIFFWASS